MNRRDLIRGIGAVICAGAIPAFIPRLLALEIPQDFSVYRNGILLRQDVDFTEVPYGTIRLESHIKADEITIDFHDEYKDLRYFISSQPK